MSLHYKQKYNNHPDQEHDEVLARLQEQLVQTNEELTVLSNTRLKLMGAIDVLIQIENSKVQEEQSEEQEENVEEGEE